MAQITQLVTSGTVATDGAWDGGTGKLIGASSNWNSATAKLQYLAPDASTWVDVDTTTLSANEMYSFQLPAGRVRMVVTGIPTALDCWVTRYLTT